ncbi:MAG: hypothetical protein U9N85_09830 [Bacteroidota bacterium]|nr:hypothetical protein [Bacteroidota bacterium]
MPFPYSYTNNIEILNHPISNIDPKKYAGTLAGLFSKLGDDVELIDEYKLSLSTTNSLFKQAYKVDIRVKRRDSEVDIEYEINLDALLRLSLIILTASAFFLFLSVTEFFIYGSLTVAAFYGINLFFINTYIQNKIEQFTGKNNHDNQESADLEKNQREWENDPYKCTACGSDLTDFDLYCPDCGIKVKQNQYSVPINLTKYQDKTVRYQYKVKERKQKKEDS